MAVTGAGQHLAPAGLMSVLRLSSARVRRQRRAAALAQADAGGAGPLGKRAQDQGPCCAFIAAGFRGTLGEPPKTARSASR
ncbi:hypothetical protein LJR290_006251 [Variovorax sp. LjRoot290]|uniref:hypothetical protein n=1 Tax=Variovorax sp. LjRoot290 TaxID=3342316 RepID=UPI003ECE280A